MCLLPLWLELIENYYDFPTECLWYASVYSNNDKRPNFNDSRGAVDEMKYAIQSEGQKPRIDATGKKIRKKRGRTQ